MQLARLIKTIVGFEGGITFDPTRPDGMPRKLMDVGFFISHWMESEHAARCRPQVGLHRVCRIRHALIEDKQ